MNYKLKQALPHIVAIILFVFVTGAYFLPQLQGEVTMQGDIVSHKAMIGELTEFKEQTGDTYHWNNGMFSGMPWGLLVFSKERNVNRYFRDAYQLGFSSPIGCFLGALIGCYLVLVLLGVNPWLSAIGAIALGFNVNFFVLWEAGHNTKLQVLSFFPLVAGGLLLALRDKLWTGGLLFALGLSLAIYGNHIQMVYYLGLLLGLFFVVYALLTIKEGKLPQLLRAAGVLVVAALLAAASNYGQLKSSREYGEDTMRGAPILEKEDVAAEAKSSSEVEGLEWNYAMNWSNGLIDVFSLLVPRVVGGSSAEEVGPDTEAGRLIRQNGGQAGSDGNYQAPMYWGPLPFTSGPYYVGALVLLLFVLGLMQLSPAMRWGFLGAIIFCCLLSMGKHAAWLNKPLFEHFPLFNKFRSPNSIMNLAPLLMVLPAFLGIQKFVKDPDPAAALRKLLIATGITGGLCLIFALLGPGLFDFTSEADARYPEGVRDVFIDTRKSLLRADAFRSLLFVLLGAGVLWAYVKDKLPSKWLLFAGLGLLVLIDLWGAGKRYMDEDNFVPESNYAQSFQLRPVDEQIKQMEPKGRGYYRVFDLSINTFNSAMTSKHHNTVGGYHPAKLQRYQDMIDYYIGKGNQRVLNMLNTKYIISREGQLQRNPGALGNAWFVDSLIFVNSPNEEIETVGKIDPGSEAVVLRREFEAQLGGFSAGNGQGTIELVEYEPDRLVYRSNTPEENLAVFSEVWYGPDKGWSIEIDGQPAEMIRVNYLLRALRVPAGEHEIVFTFTPELGGAAKAITSLGAWIIFLGLLGFAGWNGYKWLQSEPVIPEPEPAPKKKTAKTSGRKRKKPGSGGKKKKTQKITPVGSMEIKEKKILLLAAHPDDGEFSCGGSLKKFTEEGNEVWYAAFSPCDKSLQPGFEKGTLYQELKRAVRHLGIPQEHVMTYDYPVRELPKYRQDILEDLVRMKKQIQPDIVLIPNGHDVHQDHHQIHLEGIRAFKGCCLLGYELIWNNLQMVTNFHIRLERRHLEAKVQALREYRSQNFRFYQDHEFIFGWARTRGVQANADFAEAFELIRWIV